MAYAPLRYGTGCNVSSVVAATRVIVRMHFVPRSRECVVGAEVVLAIGCSHPRFIELPRNPVSRVRFVVSNQRKLITQTLFTLSGFQAIFCVINSELLLRRARTAA
jgi:hypothetical protein